MAGIFVPNEGEITLMSQMLDLSNYTGVGGAGQIMMSLFKANHTPAASDTLSTYSAIKSDFPGYADIDISNTWVVATDVPNSKAKATRSTNAVFTCTGGGSSQTSYGYYVWWSVSLGIFTRLMYAFLFTTAAVMVNNGDTITITPVLTLGTDPSPT